MRGTANHSTHSLPGTRYRAYRAELDAAMAAVFEDGHFILGAQTAAFEREFAEFLGARHCLGVASGTDALELALRACGIGPGDAVLTVSWTASATVAAIERAGAAPVLVDIDAETYTMDPERLQEDIVEYFAVARSGQPRLKAIVPVHLYGQPVDMRAIVPIARRHGLCIIEDCAQSHGATLDHKMTGTWGDLAAFSFYPTKNLGAFGDAGAVVTDDAALAEQVRLLREYGWHPRPISVVSGINSRLDEVQAALLRVLLKHLPAENTKRQALARHYDSLLSGTDLTPPSTRASAQPVFHQYVIRTSHRDQLKAFLEAAGVPTQIHYPVPVHLQPAYQGRLVRGASGLRRTEAAAAEVLSLPISPHLAEEEIRRLSVGLSKWHESGRKSSWAR